MSDYPRSIPPASRVRIGIVSALVAIAFLLGLALAIVLVRRQNERARFDTTPVLTDSVGASPAAAPPLAAAAPQAAPQPASQPAIDPTALAARQAVLSGQIAALEARAGTLAASAAAAGGQAARAEALLTAVAARRALDRGAPLGGLDAQLETHFGQAQPRAVAVLRDAARQPTTLEDLRDGLEAIGPLLTTGAGRSWVEGVRQGLRTLVVFRRAGAPSPLPADHLARARRLLDQGQVETARIEVAQLPGAGEAGGWLAAARRYALARQALDLLENTALAGQVQPATAQPPHG